MRIRPGQVAVVTGAANGIGRALVSRLVAAGVKVVMADVEEAPLRVAEIELQFFGGDVLAVPTDVTDLTEVERLRDRALEHYGRVDLIVNNAGVIGPKKPVWELEASEWKRTTSVNLDGVFYMLKVFVPELVTRGRGHVVNVASVLGTSTTPLMGDYAASKHAVVGLTETLRSELPAEIGVTLVLPGPVRTRLLDGENDLMGIAQSPSAVADQIVAAVDAGRMRLSPNSLLMAA
ncbi:SDR family oxidoreductase [Lentzea sp. NBRC 105346]|uniref:SDR family NAD(P)-dependent oxidoreductase n=1 Tax=Lentzea sp. NBRC 105346 TaxID=3032205 RepID=UPI002554E82B|nr:SDR family oxidoreductase [Lentzea sp. NBRC 105346]